MTSREFKNYSKKVFGGKKVIDYRMTQTRFYDNRMSQVVNTPQGLAQISISTDKNGAIIEIEAGLILGRDASGKNIVQQKCVRNKVYNHYLGQPFDFVDFYYIGETVFPKL